MNSSPTSCRLSDQLFKMEKVEAFLMDEVEAFLFVFFFFAVDEVMCVKHPAWSCLLRADLAKWVLV